MLRYIFCVESATALSGEEDNALPEPPTAIPTPPPRARFPKAKAKPRPKDKARHNPGAEPKARGANPLEARPGSSPSTVRAWCEGADGRRVAVCGKNGAGEALAQAVGLRAEVRFRGRSLDRAALRRLY